MIKTTLVRNEGYRCKELKPFFASSITIIGFRHIKSNFNTYGRVQFLFVISDKMGSDEVIFLHTMFEITNKEEMQMIDMHPSNIDNFSKEIYDKMYLPIAEKMQAGENCFACSFEFTKLLTPEKVAEYYQVKGIYSHKDAKTEVVKPINLSKANWIRISQFFFSLSFKKPFLNFNIFQDFRYENIKVHEVTGMIYDGSTDVMGDNNKIVIMAHFTLFVKGALNTKFGINVPCIPVKGKIRRNIIDSDTYVKNYINDDRISMDRIFSILSPQRLSALISGSIDGKELWMFTLTEEKVKELNWLNWGHYVYFNKGENDK